MSGVSAVWDLHTETREEERLAELEEKIKAGIQLSREESAERWVLQGTEYDRLAQADKKGMFGLSKEKKARLEKYKNDNAAARIKEDWS